MTQKILLLTLTLFLFIISACATHQPGFEKPVVTISSFEAIPAQGILPQFKIGLHIVNPNRSRLVLKGISYSIALEGHKILTGVSNRLPQIEAYGEGNIDLHASVDFLSSINFVTDLLHTRQKDNLSYRFDAKLDAGTLYPLIRVSKKGTLFINQSGFD